MPEAPFFGLRPYGHIDLDLLDVLAENLRRLFPFEVKILEQCGAPEFAFNNSRQQYMAKAILEDLVSNAPASCRRVLGLTEADLFIPILTYVYGEAMLPGQAAVISLYRLTGSDSGPTVPFEVLAQRAVKEAVHELGHTFNLVHCDHESCVMSFAHSLEHIDRKSERFCRYCSVLFSDAMMQKI